MVAARRLLLGTVAVGCALAAVVFCFGGVAFAAAPEAPSQPTVSSTKATPVEEVSLFGFLYPGAPGEPGSYEFLYKQSATECQGGSKGPVGAATGEQFEAVFETLTGLQPGERYTICLAVTSPGGTTLSAPVTILTPIAPEQPTGLKAEPVGAFTATLNGTLNPSGERKAEPGTYEYLYRQSPSECEGEEEGQLSTAPTTAAGAKEEVVSVAVTSLLPNTQYTFCLRQTNEIGEVAMSDPVTFTTLAAAPRIENVGASRVTSDSATLSAQINPEGAETSYAFEYAPEGGVFVRVPEARGAGVLSAGPSGVVVSAHVQDLNPRGSYQFRVVVSNAVETLTSATVRFTTQGPGVPFALPDGRAWEMVSPEQKQGTLFLPIQEGIIQAAADGEAFSGESFFEPTEEKAASTYGLYEDDFFGRGQSGWASRTITLPHSNAGTVPVGNGQEYWFFSQDLSKAIAQPFGQTPPLAPDVSQTTPYLRTDFLNGDRGDLCSTGCFQPLVDDANVPPGTPYGEEPTGVCQRVRCGPEVLGATPDLDHVLLASPVDLTGDAPGGGIYEWSAGQLAFIGKGALGPLTPVQGLAVVRHAISDDGSRVFISGSYGGVEGLLMRDAATGETVRLDVPPASPGQPEFEVASADGSKVFFTDGESERSLYEYDFSAPAGSRLTDLSIPENSGEQARVISVVGASEDGSYVYFAATGVLAPGATQATCSGGQPCMNIYVSHAGATKLVAALSGEDSPDWNVTPGKLTARVSPDGRWFAFMSNRDLTGYDSTDALSAEKDEEVYLYDATSARLVCASCNPTGARPSGVEYGNTDVLVTADRVFDSSTWIASNVPPVTRHDLGEASYQSRYLSDSGRLFFDSHDALVPQDVNGNQDVYQYEPPGIGDCALSQPSFSQRSGGCVSLISSGESSEESAFLDASESGGDVFFLTSGDLAPQDLDGAYDIYDARECGADGSRCFPRQPVGAPPCESGDACKPAPSPQPPIFGSPASSTFSGTGDIAPTASALKPKSLTRAQRLSRALKACHREQGKRRKSCERRARARFAAKRSNRSRKTGRSAR